MVNLTYRAVENSKNSSGESGNNPAGGSGQLTVAQITQLCSIAASMGCTHFQTHVYADTDAQMQVNYLSYAANYNLRTLEQEAQAWADAIHAAGMKHVWRGSWSAIKGNNNFAFATYPAGTNYVPLGTVSGASTEGETTYCGKFYRFLNTNLGAAHIQNGDIFMPISEFTEYLAHANYLWFDTSGGTQAGAYLFFDTLHLVLTAWATANGKTLDFATIVNYSEYKTGYLDNTLPADTNHIAIDYYGHSGYSAGQHVEPADYVADWIAVRNQVGGAGYPLYQTELGGIWGDSWPTIGATPAAYSRKITTYEDAALYQIQLYKAYRDNLVDPALMNGVSLWSMWSGQNTSIVYFSASNYKINYFGQIFANFIKGNGMARIPVLQEGSFNDDAWGGRSAHF